MNNLPLISFFRRKWFLPFQSRLDRPVHNVHYRSIVFDHLFHQLHKEQSNNRNESNSEYECFLYLMLRMEHLMYIL